MGGGRDRKETKEQLLGRLVGYDKYLRQKESSSDGQTSQNRVVDRWRRVKTLIVDESKLHSYPEQEFPIITIMAVSMIDGDLFDKLVRGTLSCYWLCILMR